MTTIKMNQEEVSQASKKLKAKVDLYLQEVAQAQCAFNESESLLKGKGQETLMAQLGKTLENQKRLVAECLVLCESIEDFTRDLSDMESNANFV